MKKTEMRHIQGETLAVMVAEELAMANEMYDSTFNSPMEGLGVLQEEMYETKKAHGILLKEYDSLQFYLCDHQEKAAADVAMKMKLRAIELAMEAIQVAAMCQKFINSEALW